MKGSQGAKVYYIFGKTLLGLIEGGANENLLPLLSGDGFEIFTSDPSYDDNRDYALWHT